MKKKLLNICAVTLLATSLSSVAYAADTTIGDKVTEVAQDTGKVVKKGVRAVKDKTCTMIKGKMECAAEKVGHKVENVADEVKDKANDVTK